MKKIIWGLILLLSFYVSSVSAEQYSTVNVITLFDEKVEINDISKIKLSFYAEGIDYVDDVSTISLELELSQENNFSTTANDVKFVDKSNLFAMVDNDRYGKYNCSIELDTSTPGIANITINVMENSYIKDDNVSISKNMLDNFLGDITTTTKKVNSNDEIIIGSKTTTHKVTQAAENLENQKKKEENKKRNKTIITILFSTLGLVILILALFVSYKFIIANK